MAACTAGRLPKTAAWQTEPREYALYVIRVTQNESSPGELDVLNEEHRGG